jgi:hypothetical protein
VCAAAAEPAPAAAAARAVKEVLAAREVEPIAPPEPCTVEGAAQAARGAAAQGAVVALVDTQPAGQSGPIRGTDLQSGHARARLELVEPDGRVSAQGEAERDAYGAHDARAREDAARDAVAEAARQIQPALAQRWTKVSSSTGVTVRLTGLQRWPDYQSVVRALAALPGVTSVEPRRFARGEAELLVKTGSPAGQLAGGLQRVPPQGIKVSVRATSETALMIDVTSPSENLNVVPERG